MAFSSTSVALLLFLGSLVLLLDPAVEVDSVMFSTYFMSFRKIFKLWRLNFHEVDALEGSDVAQGN